MHPSFSVVQDTARLNIGDDQSMIATFHMISNPAFEHRQGVDQNRNARRALLHVQALKGLFPHWNALYEALIKIAIVLREDVNGKMRLSAEEGSD